MITETNGIVLRQTKIQGGRRMVLLLSEKYGKISAGTGLNEKKKGKQALAIRPFTYGRYEIYSRGDFYNINSGEPLKSFYKIGEELDKYMNASFALEMTDKLTAEGQPAPDILRLAVDMLCEMEIRSKKFGTIAAAYVTKLMKLLGVMPQLDTCAKCEGKGELVFFSITDGGFICESCAAKSPQSQKTQADRLIYKTGFGIIDILRYFLQHPLSDLRKLALDEDVSRQIIKMMTEYARYHFDIGNLKSEAFITG